MLPRLRQWTRARFFSSIFPSNIHAEQAANYEEIVEGSARALYEKGQVFYNPVQVVNRDLSVQVLRWLVRERGPDAKPIRILEALSASGLRSIRYFNEVPNVGCVVANDMDPNAVETIRRNVLYNGLSPETDIIPNVGDAIEVLTLARAREKQYDVVDLDPYGSAAPFLDSAVQAVTDGGVLAITCTDLPVLCGNSPEICFGRYAGTPLKGSSGHEMAVRIVFAAVQQAANRHGRAVEALLCAKIDFYVRLFVRVRNSKFLAQQTPSRLAQVYQCSSCNTKRYQPLGRIRTSTVSNTARKKRRTAKNATKKEEVPANGDKLQGDTAVKLVEVRKYTPPLVSEHISSCCTICGGAMLLGGPIWTGPLIQPEVGESILEELSKEEKVFKARSRVEAIIRLLSEEVPDAPLFLQLPAMCRVLKVSAPPSASVRSFITSKGYQVSQSHTDPLALKTNAPPELLWDILRVWVHKVGNPFNKVVENDDDVDMENGKSESKKNYDVGANILAKPPVLVKPGEVDFSVKKDKYVRRSSAAPTAPRYPQNPTPNWGPKARAGKRPREAS